MPLLIDVSPAIKKSPALTGNMATGKAPTPAPTPTPRVNTTTLAGIMAASDKNLPSATRQKAQKDDVLSRAGFAAQQAAAKNKNKKTSGKIQVVTTDNTGNLTSNTETQTPTDTSGTGGATGETAAAVNPEDTELYKNTILGDFLKFQQARSDEMRRLRDMETELFGQGGKTEQQNTADKRDRRRLAAQMAAAGTLQGGAYAGAERGLDTLRREAQTNALNELLRPFVEQTASDRLTQLGIDFTGRGRGASDVAQQTYGGTFAMKPGEFDWTKSTYAGQIAAQQARTQALQQLLSGLVNV